MGRGICGARSQPSTPARLAYACSRSPSPFCAHGLIRVFQVHCWKVYVKCQVLSSLSPSLLLSSLLLQMFNPLDLEGPFLVAFYLCIFWMVVCFIAGVLTNNVSQVDKLCTFTLLLSSLFRRRFFLHPRMLHSKRTCALCIIHYVYAPVCTSQGTSSLGFTAGSLPCTTLWCSAGPSTSA